MTLNKHILIGSFIALPFMLLIFLGFSALLSLGQVQHQSELNLLRHSYKTAPDTSGHYKRNVTYLTVLAKESAHTAVISKSFTRQWLDKTKLYYTETGSSLMKERWICPSANFNTQSCGKIIN